MEGESLFTTLRTAVEDAEGLRNFPALRWLRGKP